MSQPLQIQLLDAKAWLGKQTGSIIEPLQKKANALLKEVRERVDDTVQSGKKILENSQGEMSKNNPKTHRFARNANRFAQNLIDTLEAIKVPNNPNYEVLHTFCDDLERTCGSLDQLRRGAYPYISPYFIFDRRRLDVSYKRLFDISKELRNFQTTKYASAKSIEDSYSLVDKLIQTINETTHNQQDMKQTQERRENLVKQIAETQRKIMEIQAKPELTELLRLNAKSEELRENVKHNLRYLQKPFFKLQSLARTSEVAVPPDEMSKLNDYLRDPFMALATDDSEYSALKSILKKLDDTIAKGKLKLKTTRIRKAQDQINSILTKDSLEQLQKNCKETLAQSKQLLASETTNRLQNELTQLQNGLRGLQKEEEFVTSRSKALESELNKLQERTVSLKKELEKKISEITHKNVQTIFAA